MLYQRYDGATNWLLGKRIAEEELRSEKRAEYGAQVIKNLSIELTARYGKGFDYSSLYKFTRFFKHFPDIFYIINPEFGKSGTPEILDSLSPKLDKCEVQDIVSPKSNENEGLAIFHAVSGKSDGDGRENIFHLVSGKSDGDKTAILYSVSPKSLPLLTWTHYRTLLQVDDDTARNWYLNEATGQTWSVRTLQRNISTQYYYRLLQSQNKASVEKEMKQKTAAFQHDKLEFIKNPVVAEFLGLVPNADFTESDLEKSIINNIEKFLIEMGKGFAFAARQQHIHTEKQDYFIDLVFYNYILKCFVLIDLKTSKITHQDVGQMDMYIRMYDELKRTEGDNPTIGIILCADTDEDIARYSVLHGNEQLFASKYKTYLPTVEELRREIERQKQIFYLQQQEKNMGVQ